MSANKRAQLTITTLLGLLATTPTHGWEANGFAGQEVIYSSDVLPDIGARGWIGGGKLLFSPGKLPIAFGLVGTYSHYAVDSQEELSDLTASRTGSMQGWHAGPTFVLQAPWQTFTPFVAASFAFGEHVYILSSESSFMSGDDQLATDLDMQLDYDAQTLTGSVGFRTGGTWGLTVEYLETRHIFTVSKAHAVARNRVNGELQNNDGGEETMAELFGNLEGDRFHHSTRGLVLGLSYRH